MLEIPEYHSLKAIGSNVETVTVSVRIDGNARMMPAIQMQPHVIARLVEAFFCSELDFMSFDEHPKRLTGVSLKRNDITPVVTSSIRNRPKISLTSGTSFKDRMKRPFKRPSCKRCVTTVQVSLVVVETAHGMRSSMRDAG